MNLVNLPDEILIIILKQLDVRSLYNLHTACDHIRNIIRTYGTIKTCKLSLSVMAKAEILKSIFFQDISRNLQDLNVSGVYDLYKTHLLQAVKRLQCLKILDVTYTNITMTDFIEIHKLCPTITDISINFSLSEPDSKILEKTLNPYQDVFKNMSNIHFVGNLYDLLLSQMPCFILKRATLKKLKYTIFDFHFDSPNFWNTLQHNDILHFDNFMIYISNIKKDNYGYMMEMIPFKLLDFLSFETIIIKNQCATKLTCYATSIFMNFFSKYFNSPLHDNIEFHIINSFDIHLEGNVFVMLWNKSVTQFDEKFFSNLWCILKPFLPCYFDSSTNTAVPPDHDFYVTIPQAKEHEIECAQVGFKRKRVVAPSYILNYDSAFQGKSKLQLALMFDCSNMKRSVTLSASCDYLKKLTYLSLSGPVRCSSDFFNILFRCCHNLATLKVKCNFLNYSAAISRSLPLSQSIKNIHLTERDIDMQRLFSSMSQCKTLENVHIVDTHCAKFSDPSIVFENCENLYCLYVYSYSTPSALKKFTIMLLNKANRKKINAKLLFNNHLLCDPYSEVFNLNVLGDN